MEPRVKCGGKTKLNTGYHPNRHLLELWKKHDEEAFRVEVVVEFDYRDDLSDPADHKDELEQLRDLYLERDGRSQEDLAQRIYVSRQTISNWETGKTYPDIHSLLLLSNLFDASVDELLKGDVVSMESKLREDSRILGRLGWAMLGFTIAALASGGIAIIVRDVGPMTEEGISVVSMVALIFACGFFLCAFGAAVWAEVLKRQNNLVTFHEIVAFGKGVPASEIRDYGALSRRHPIASNVLKICSGAVFALIAIVLFEIIAKCIRDFIFLG